MPTRLHRSMLIFLILFALFRADAAVWIVPEDFPTIQAAIDAAGAHDTIMIMPGRYYENLVIQEKPLTITSFYEYWGDMNIRDQTIIDAGNNSSAIQVWQVQPLIVIKGLVLTNGYYWKGGGIRASSSHIVLKDMVITLNQSEMTTYGGGAGLYITSWCTAEITNCDISSNVAFDYGAAICLRLGSELTCSGSTFRQNIVTGGGSHSKGGAVMIDTEAQARFEYCSFTGNSSILWGGAMAINGDGNIKLINCTFSDNIAGVGGGAFYMCYTGANLFSGNTIFYGNWPNEIHFDDGCYDNTVSICYSDVENVNSISVPPTNALRLLSGNIELNPVFAAPWDDDYSLESSSPCIDSGTDFFIDQGDTLVYIPDSLFMGEAPDMGAFEFDPPVGVPAYDFSVTTIRIWPQPVRDRLCFSLEENVKKEVCTLYTLHGKRVDEFAVVEESTQSHDISHLLPGIYVLTITGEGKSWSEKFVKQ